MIPTVFDFQRFHHEKANFLSAHEKCQSMDSDLIIMNSFDENKYIYDFANRDQVDVWLGIYENVIIAWNGTYIIILKFYSCLYGPVLKSFMVLLNYEVYKLL